MKERDVRTERRRRREARGRRAELLAALALRLRGYRVLARRWRSPVGEIDLIVARGRTIAFVEVKARDSLDAAAESVSPHQRRRVARAAAHFLAGRPRLADRDLRFDVVLVAPGRWPRHVPAAWTETPGPPA